MDVAKYNKLLCRIFINGKVTKTYMFNSWELVELWHIHMMLIMRIFNNLENIHNNSR